MDQSISRINGLSVEEATAEFLKCCGSSRWARQMSDARPFSNWQELSCKADEIWWKLAEADWLEAFRAHPKIGEKKAASAQSPQASNWSAQEQSGVADASSQTIDELADLNREYERRFGFIFIVCATGKSSDEMLEALKRRCQNEAATEIRIAAEEQSKITRLRLEKLLQQS